MAGQPVVNTQGSDSSISSCRDGANQQEGLSVDLNQKSYQVDSSLSGDTRALSQQGEAPVAHAYKGFHEQNANSVVIYYSNGAVVDSKSEKAFVSKGPYRPPQYRNAVNAQPLDEGKILPTVRVAKQQQKYQYYGAWPKGDKGRADKSDNWRNP
ncbi:hypothetical protein [Parashewanella curva]|uniref:hypothetical protein n=1 Tax=Parashewanella curva TaxID=2338552 RepID=UPI00105991B3|nr:hypothetical protein [Parashewanella curva]